MCSSAEPFFPSGPQVEMQKVQKQEHMRLFTREGSNLLKLRSQYLVYLHSTAEVGFEQLRLGLLQMDRTAS